MKLKMQKTNENNWRVWISSLFLISAFFVFIGCLWVKETYGVLLIATANPEFMNYLQNKRSIFVVKVCIPTFLFAFFVGIGTALSLRRKLVKIQFLKGVFILLAVILCLIGVWEIEAGAYVKHCMRLGQEQWYDDNRVVIHALGTIDDITYTNSKEALEKSYAEGNKVFECDMILTEDKRLVACHDWGAGLIENFSEENVPTKQEFMNSKIYNRYTTMSVDEIVIFMKEHPDVYIVTDTKSGESDYYSIEFQEWVDTAEKYHCEDILGRVVVQIYHAYMYGDIQKIYPFQNIIYTLYSEGYRGDPEQMKEYAEFCRMNEIDVLTMREEFYSDELNEICRQYGIELFVHTVNDPERKEYFEARNVGIYTD